VALDVVVVGCARSGGAVALDVVVVGCARSRGAVAFHVVQVVDVSGLVTHGRSFHRSVGIEPLL
jgi:hypothetical protein